MAIRLEMFPPKAEAKSAGKKKDPRCGPFSEIL
jgi:hypothetical protein